MSAGQAAQQRSEQCEESAVDPADLHLQRALDCFSWADELPNRDDREALREMALAWLRLGERQDDYWRHAGAPERRRRDWKRRGLPH